MKKIYIVLVFLLSLILVSCNKNTQKQDVNINNFESLFSIESKIAKEEKYFMYNININQLEKYKYTNNIEVSMNIYYKYSNNVMYNLDSFTITLNFKNKKELKDKLNRNDIVDAEIYYIELINVKGEIKIDPNTTTIKDKVYNVPPFTPYYVGGIQIEDLEKNLQLKEEFINDKNEFQNNNVFATHSITNVKMSGNAAGLMEIPTTVSVFRKTDGYLEIKDEFNKEIIIDNGIDITSYLIDPTKTNESGQILLTPNKLIDTSLEELMPDILYLDLFNNIDHTKVLINKKSLRSYRLTGLIRDLLPMNVYLNLLESLNGLVSQKELESLKISFDFIFTNTIVEIKTSLFIDINFLIPTKLSIDLTTKISYEYFEKEDITSDKYLILS